MAEMLATLGAELLHVTARPVNTFPPASRATAVNGSIQPTGILPDPGETETVATGGSTVTDAIAERPSAVAEIATEPAATAVTVPLEFTVATAGLADAHVTARPVSGAPVES
jgi:hypothetical protein